MEKEEIEILEEERKKVTTNIRSEYDLLFIQKDLPGFVTCKANFVEESISYHYDLTGLEPLENILKYKLIDQLRTLMSVVHIECLQEQYIFSLSPKNLYYTKDNIIKVKERDIPGETKPAAFLDAYKSLIGSIFLKEYTYENIINGGISLLEKDKRLEGIIAAKTVEELHEALLQWYIKEEEKMSDMVFVPKKRDLITKVSVGILSFVLVILSVFTIYQQFFVVKDKDVLLKASSYFIDNKFVDTIDTLDDIGVSSLNKEARYMLAISYIKSSNLQGEPRDNALAQIKLQGSEDYTLFWIYLGRKEFDDVYELLNKINNERLLHYAYSVELESLTTNTELTTEEKSTRKETLEKAIEAYLEKVNQVTVPDEGAETNGEGSEATPPPEENLNLNPPE